MAGRVAVVTDALSPDLIFPIWHRYYSGLFGAASVFVVTYGGLAGAFKSFDLGGLIELPVGYDDNTRRKVISGFVTSLLGCFDTVIRVDADEFLVVDPRSSVSLSEYLANFDAPYLSARGFDVCQMPEEPALPEVPDFPILRDRSFAYPNTALNKTCITRVPVAWCQGFHFASVYPKFGPLFMLHMKRLDIGWQLNWFTRMSENITSNPTVPDSLRAYYQPDEEKIRAYHKGVAGRPRLAGIETWYRPRLTAEYLQKIAYDPASGLYHGTYDHELVLCEIPPEWKSIF